MGRKISVDKIRLPGVSVTDHTPALTPDLSHFKATKIAQLWESCYAFNFNYFSGGVYAMLLKLELYGSAKAAAVSAWLETLWEEYYRRKAAIEAATSSETIMLVSMDFTSQGPPPYTVPEILAEGKKLITSKVAALPPLPKV